MWRNYTLDGLFINFYQRGCFMKRTSQIFLLVSLIANVSVVSAANSLPDPIKIKKGALIIQDVLASIDINGKEGELRKAIESKYDAKDVEKIFKEVDKRGKEGSKGLLFGVKIVAPDDNQLDEQEDKIAYLIRVATLSAVNRLGKEVLDPQPINLDGFVLNQPIRFTPPTL